MSCLVYCLVSRLMNAFKGECLCLCETPININKLFIVMFVFCLRCPCSVVVVRLLVDPLFLHCTLLLPVYFFIRFFILMLLLYFCLFVNHVNKPIIFVFGALVYHFNNAFPLRIIMIESSNRIAQYS